ncbi:hypothetical protein HS7_15290 [Sulfolobales archaeon HS-7]|nr:hypothetical protein HS7_15290 [Sulfolobales archaeon HS-7]
MRVLYVSIGDPPTSGATTTISELIKRGKDHGIDFDILEFLLQDEKGLSSINGVIESAHSHSEIRLKYKKNFTGRSFLFFFKRTEMQRILSAISKNYDFVIGFRTQNSVNILYSMPYIEFPLIRLYLKMAKTTNPIEGLVWLNNVMSTYKYVKKSTRNICAGKILQEEIRAKFGIECEPLDPPGGVSEEKVEKIRGISYDAIHVARLGEVKGTPDAIYVMKYLKENGFYRFAIAGPLDFGFNLGMNNDISYLGNITNREKLYSLMASSGVLIYPSKLDTFGLTVAESLYNGLPVVGYNIPALKYYFGNCDAVKLVNVGDKEGLAERALELLGDSLEARKDAEECGRKFSWDNVVDSFHSILEGFISKGGV